MVFSFFKKQPSKMPERPAVRPKAPAAEVLPKVVAIEEPAPAEPLPDLEFTTGNMPPPVSRAPAPRPEAQEHKALRVREDDAFDLDEFDRDFTDSSVMAIDVAHDIDPLQSDLEQAVVLFANGQDAAARNLLEAMLRTYPGREGLRFWHLLFDLLQIIGDRPAFEKLGVEYAEACETSPPTWRQEPAMIAPMASGPKLFKLQGVLTGECIAPLAELADTINKKEPALIECGKLIGCDDEIAGRLAELLSLARHKRILVTLDHPEAVMRRLSDRLIAGEAVHAASWLLLLELLQRYGTQEAFEERAVDYAVTFELSPPSWEAPSAVAAAKVVATGARRDGAHYLSGELKSCRFDELTAVIEREESPILDFSGVRRIDFFSAGQLVNRLAPYKTAGREIVIRSPNHLVAELMAVVGLNKQARIIVPKS